MQAPGFWDDQDRAAKISAEHSRATGRLTDFRALHGEVDELSELSTLLREEDRAGALDPGMVDELATSLSRVEAHIAELEEERLFGGEHDAGGAIISINAGEGGTDAQDWAEMLLRMYLRWAERRRLSAEINEATEGTEAGLKSVTFTVKGMNAYGLMSAERGVHRLVRLSPFDAAHRRQTSFAAVQVSPLPDGEIDFEIDEKDLRVDTYRASGAGGQHVNKTESAVRITHIPTKTVVQCQNERSQMQNRATAMSMLKSRLLELEIERREEETARERGESRTIGFGSQIRSYVLQPYTMVKDLRTQHETGNVQAVLDGEIDAFIRAELERRASGGTG
jgi:peptide chain release factor 2